MAAAYLFHIVQNHPFLDGNKRTGTTTALAFLELNGLEIVCPNDKLADTVLEVAQGRLTKPAVAEFLRKHGKPTTT
jgi:death-on-curing protein